MDIVQQKFPYLLKYYDEIGFRVPAVPLDESIILDPFSFNPYGVLRDFSLFFRNVGITGSYLYEGDGNDIDLLSFDENNYKILRLLRQQGITSPLESINSEEVEGLDSRDFLNLKKFRVLEGFFKGIPYTFKIVRCEDFGKVMKMEEFSGTLEIKNAIKPYSIPVKYYTDNFVLTSFRTRYTELEEGKKIFVKGKVLRRDIFNDLDLDIAEEVKILS
ncbi:hypothetical protein [Acidianus brierleyi]|nr:hypothetical protein [Acidianus brierleyi]